MGKLKYVPFYSLKREKFLFWGPFLESTEDFSGHEKPLIILRFAYSGKLVFSHFVKGIKILITGEFRASRRLCFEDINRIMSLEKHPKSFGIFENRAPGPELRIASRAESVIRRFTFHTFSFDAVNLSIFASRIWTSRLELEFLQNLETRDHARDST